MSIFYMFSHVYDVTYVEIQFSHSKLCNLIRSWKMAKNTIKFYRRCFLYKTNKKCKENQGWHVLYICGCDVSYAEFETLYRFNFVKSVKKAAKLCTRLFLHKINKNLSWKPGSSFGLRDLLFMLTLSLNSCQYMCPKIFKTRLPRFWPSYATDFYYE